MIGNVLKELRSEKNMTQEQVASFLNVKRQTYGAYERNISIPDANTIKILAKYFNVSADTLLEVETANPQGQPLTKEQHKIALATQELSSEDIEKVIEFVEFVKSKRSL